MAIFRLTTGNERVRLNRGGEVDTVVVESGSRRDVDRVLRFGREDRIDLRAFGDIDAQELIDEARPRGRRAVILQGDFGRLVLGGITKAQLRPSNFITSTSVDGREIRTIESNDALDLELAIERASDLSRYTEEELASVTELVIEIEPDALTPDGSSRLERLGFRRRRRYRRDTIIVELPRDEIIRDDSSLIAQLERIDGIEYYPLVKIEPVLDYIPNDPRFSEQWHLLNTGQTGGRAGVDANVTAAWDIPNPRNPSQTVRGRDVVIGIVDGGLDITHPDIAERYRSDLSRDFHNIDGELSPSDIEHGTRVAGIAAADGDNGIGVTGAAPQALIAGLQLIQFEFTDEQVSDALSWQNQEIDIYQNSWSPTRILDLRGPAPLSLETLQNGVRDGRGGRGNIYVFSAGNNREAGLGPSGDDNVNYNGYANSRYTIAVGAIDHNGVHPPYSEPGAPLLISAPSSEGLGRDVGVGVTTTSAENDYTDEFGGTSAAAPLVSGVIALMLEANPELSWRDVQHIIVETAEQNDPSNPDWVINGAGFPVNHLYGFGAIDAAAAVQGAIDWTPVAEEIVIAKEFTGELAVPDNLGGVSTAVTINSDIQVEWAEVVFEATHPRRGDWEIVLVSPDGTESILAEERPDGNSDIDWTFTSARHWGESSVGEWTLRVSDLNSGETGTLDFAELRLIGTANEFGERPNQPPIAVDDVATTGENSSVSIDVLANDSGDPLSFQGIPSSTEFGGLVSLNGGTIAYTPAFGFAGTDSFNYTIGGGNGSTDSATVTVTVESANRAPIALNDVASTQENSPVNIPVLANDFDLDADEISIPVNAFFRTTENGGTIVRDNNGTPANSTDDSLIYTPANGFSGTDSFRYTISDAQDTDTATVTVIVESSAIDGNAQIITPVPSTQIVSAGDTVSIDVNYATNPAETPTNGTVFRLHWDSSQLEFDPATDLENIFSLGQPTGVIEDDPITNGGFDGDPNTDKYFVQSWIDFSGNWPNILDPTLYTANFTARSGFSGAAINFTTDTANLPGPDFQLVATSAKFLTTPFNDIPSGTIVGSTTPNSDSILDVDDNGQVGGLTDGNLIIKYLVGLTGNALTNGSVAADANRSSSIAIQAYLDQISGSLDVDGNGVLGAFSDGVLIERYALGLRGDPLISGAVADDATRSTVAEIENYLGSL